jgi:hypothetical protein
MLSGAFRLCPQCQTRNKAYMAVCTHCSRSLAGVALSGTATGYEAAFTPRPTLASRGVRFAVVAGLAVAVALGVGLTRLFRARDLEPAAAAAPSRPRPAPKPAPAGEWTTIEDRWAAVSRRPIPPPPVPREESMPVAFPVADPAPVPVATPPAVAYAPAAPAVPVAPASPEAVAASLPAVVRTAPLQPRRAPTYTNEDLEATRHPVPVREPEPVARPRPRESDEDEDDHASADAQRALRRAEARMRTLERRAAELRGEIASEPELERRDELERRLSDVIDELEQAERERVRAQWGARVQD